MIVSVNEHSVRDSGSLKAAIGLLRPGEKVVVGVIRDGHPLKVSAVLGEAPAAAAHTAPSEDQPGTAPLDPASSKAPSSRTVTRASAIEGARSIILEAQRGGCNHLILMR